MSRDKAPTTVYYTVCSEGFNKNGSEQFKVSKFKEGLESFAEIYLLTLSTEGSWTCDCPATYRLHRGQKCKHAALVQHWIGQDRPKRSYTIEGTYNDPKFQTFMDVGLLYGEYP